MSFDKDVNIDNSFNIALENPTQSVQRVAMFELGSDDPDIILQEMVAIVNQPNAVHNSWTMGFGSGVLPNPLTLDTTTSPPTITCTWDNAFTWNINGVFYSITLAPTWTLQRMSAEVNDYVDGHPVLKYMRINFIGVLDPDNLEPTIAYLRVNITYLTKDPITGATAGYFTGDPNDPSNPMLITDYGMTNFPPASGIADFYQSAIQTQPAIMTQTTKNSWFGVLNLGAVQVVVGQGTPYNEILESQNGQVLDIKSMRIDAMASLGNPAVPFYQDKQLLVPLRFSKKDATGNDLTYNKIPTIDPYQYQKCVDFIDMKTKADTFALDGTTKFALNIQPYTTMRLSCNYTSITNLIADTEYSAEMVAKEKEAIAKQKEAGDNSRTYNLKVPDDVIKGIENQNVIYKKQQDQLQKLEKKKTNYYIHLPLHQKNLWCWVG